jgi:hypothetical protein
MAQQGVILGRTLELIAEALDHNDPDHAAAIASEVLAELRRRWPSTELS